MTLFCAAIRRDSVFLLRFPFLSHVQVFSCEILLIRRLKVIIIIIIIIFFTPYGIFIPALADVISLESEWLQITLGIQDSS